MSAFAAALCAVPLGRAEAFFGVEFAQARQLIPALGAQPGHRVILMQRFDRLPGTDALIDAVHDTLAATTAASWPVWYTDIDFGDLRPADFPGMVERIAARLANLPEVSPLWCSRAAARVLAGQGPASSDEPIETQLQQLALAISRNGLVLVTAIADPAPSPGALHGLAHVAAWLARRGRMAVAVLMPADWEGHPELLSLAPGFVAGPLRAVAPPDGAAATDAPGTEPEDVWLWPVLGRPHPNSPGEQALARALRADPQLGPLFAFNRAVPTLFLSTPIVDLLWAAGRVVVEVDGDSHRQVLQYAADRQRDFELLVSGYLVLRLAHDEVMTDTARAVEKIRKVVDYHRTHRPETPDP